MFKDKEILLRPLEKEDLNKIKEWQNDYEISKYTSVDTFTPRSLIEEEKWLERQYNSNTKRIFIILLDTLKIGYILYSGLDLKNRVCWIGIAIGEKQYQNQGIATRSLMILENYLKNELNIRKIKVQILSNNLPSLRLFQKMNYHEEAVLKDEIYRDDKYLDIHILSKFLYS